MAELDEQDDESADIPRRVARRVGAALAALALLIIAATALVQLDLSGVAIQSTDQADGTAPIGATDHLLPEPLTGREEVLKGRVRGSGDAWSLTVWLVEGGDVCMQLDGVTCGPIADDVAAPLVWTPNRTITLLPSGGYRQCALGTVAPDVGAIDLDLFEGGRVRAAIASSSLHPMARFYADCWQNGPGIERLTVRHAGGAVLATIGPQHTSLRPTPRLRRVLAEGGDPDKPWRLLIASPPLQLELRTFRKGQESTQGLGGYSEPSRLDETHQFCVHGNGRTETLIAGPVHADAATITVTASGQDVQPRIITVGNDRVFLARFGRGVALERIRAIDPDGQFIDGIDKQEPSLCR